MEIGIEAFRWNEVYYSYGAGFASSAPHLFLYPQLALWARRMPPASLAMSQKSHGQSTSTAMIRNLSNSRQTCLAPHRILDTAMVPVWRKRPRGAHGFDSAISARTALFPEDRKVQLHHS